MTSTDIQKYRVEIETDLLWRLDEIAFYTNQLNNFRAINLSDFEKIRIDNDKTRYRKLLVLILYAHFEGFFRYAFEVYVNALNKEDIDISKALDVLTVSSLQKSFLEYDMLKEQINQDSSEFSKHNKRVLHRLQLIQKIDTSRESGKISLHIGKDYKDQASVIYTESNLNPEIIDRILFRLGFSNDALNLNDNKFRLEINEFLGRRHSIAHGDGKLKEGVTDKQYNGFRASFDRVINTIPIIITKAMNDKLYLKPEFR